MTNSMCSRVYGTVWSMDIIRPCVCTIVRMSRKNVWSKTNVAGPSGLPEKKRQVTVKTVEENDKEHNTATWLAFKKHDREYIMTLPLCIRFEEKHVTCET